MGEGEKRWLQIGYPERKGGRGEGLGGTRWWRAMKRDEIKLKNIFCLYIHVILIYIIFHKNTNMLASPRRNAMNSKTHLSTIILLFITSTIKWVFLIWLSISLLLSALFLRDCLCFFKFCMVWVASWWVSSAERSMSFIKSPWYRTSSPDLRSLSC